MDDRRTVRSICGACAALLAVAVAVAVAPAAVPAQQPRVLVVGDSLADGLQPFLPAMLPGRFVEFAAHKGWTTPLGMKALRAALRTAIPQTLVVSLGTNDGPDPRRFGDRVRRTLRTAPADACVIWPAIYRPPRKGDYRALNRALRSAALRDPRLVVIAWDETVRRGTVALPDGLHPDQAGFRWRSQLIADAVAHGC